MVSEVVREEVTVARDPVKMNVTRAAAKRREVLSIRRMVDQ